MKSILGFFLFGVAALSLAVSVRAAGFDQGAASWARGTTAADWKVVYNGGGEVDFDPVEGILMRPQAALRLDETHAALVLDKETLERPLRDFRVTVKVTTEAQLRAGKPNPWEVFWLFFNYTLDGGGKKRTNYLIVKPAGPMELGKASGDVRQEFLATREEPTVPLGREATIVLVKKGGVLSVFVDGKLSMTYESGPDGLYDVPGAIGLYCEDSQVRVRDVVIQPLP